MNMRELKKHMQYKIPQIRLALLREPHGEQVAIHCPADILQFAQPLRYYPDENFVAFFLDVRLHVIGYSVISHGTISSSLVHPREVFKAALLCNSHAIIVAHNHPTGITTASQDDLDTTKILIKAGEIIGIGVIDHLIVTTLSHRSIREDHPELWTSNS